MMQGASFALIRRPDSNRIISGSIMPDKRDYATRFCRHPLTGHAADMPKSTRMSRNGHSNWAAC